LSYRAQSRPDAPTAPAELIESLQRLGFTDYEAKAYLALSSGYPATAYEVAKVSGLPRANVYSVLRTLELKGAIQPVGEIPRRYAPVDPEDFFGRYARNTAALCTSLAQQMKTQTHPNEDAFVWHYTGEADVTEKVTELVRNAKSSIWIKAPDHLIKPYLPILKAATKRGVQVILVVFGDEYASLQVDPAMIVFPHEGDAIKRGAADVLFTMTTDFSGVLISTHHAEQGVVGSYARNRAIVYVVQTLFLHEFYLAEMYQKIGGVLDATFGKELAKLRKKYRPKDMEKNVLDGP
jgi:HTH-type transcriptional regulator, sugar sensing transcriptional regulator